MERLGYCAYSPLAVVDFFAAFAANDGSDWTAALGRSIAALAIVGVVAAVILLARIARIKKDGGVAALHVCATFGVAAAVFICLIPVNMEEVGGGTLRTVLFSLHNTLQAFTTDIDSGAVIARINESAGEVASFYSTYMSVLFVVAPVLTFTFIASFFKNISAHIKYFLRFFGRVYIFSELNEKSLALAADIKRLHFFSTIVFTDVFSKNEERSYELISEAQKLGAVCFKKDILAVNFRWHCPLFGMFFFAIGANETENITQSLKLITKYGRKKNSHLFVFSTRVEGEVLLTRASQGCVMKIRRINEVRSLVYRHLLDGLRNLDGQTVFEQAAPLPDGSKRISALIVGLGQHGTEMLKALAWYCTMDGYSIRIDAFDRDPLAREKFYEQCPGLLAENIGEDEYSPEELGYDICIHSGVDVETSSFADTLRSMSGTTYVFVSLGSDEANIKAAVRLRTLFEGMGIAPTIQAIVYNSDEKEALEGITNFRDKSYRIDFIGDLRSSFSESVIIHSALEEQALREHMEYGSEEDFWRYEYNYRSTIAGIIHTTARYECGIPGADKERVSDLTEEQKDIIGALEQRRWTVYMRTEGYVYSGSVEKNSRDDMAKRHNLLVRYEKVPDDMRSQNYRVGRFREVEKTFSERNFKWFLDIFDEFKVFIKARMTRKNARGDEK